MNYHDNRKFKRLKIIFFLGLFVFGFTKTYNYLDNLNIYIDDKILIKLLFSNYSKRNEFINIKNLINTKSLIRKSYHNLVNYKDLYVKKDNSNKISNDKLNTKPLVYLYNSHQSEEYASNTFLEYNFIPTVMSADYIIKDIFDKNNINTIVEEENINNVLHANNLNYNGSYRASRILMEKAYQNNSSLKYFIDIHRDSLTRDKTLVEINGKKYAKILFLIGLENSNYNDNLIFTESINNKLNQKYPNLSKGILKKGGVGVNGVYNQDFSKYTILVEIGGYQNSLDEVMNSAVAFSDVFMEVINENKG